MWEPVRRILAAIAISAPEYSNRLTAALPGRNSVVPSAAQWDKMVIMGAGRASEDWPSIPPIARFYSQPSRYLIKTVSTARPTAATHGPELSPATRATRSSLIPQTAILPTRPLAIHSVGALRASSSPRTVARLGEL